MEYDVVISGMGIAGLTAAYETAKRHCKVALVEKREAVFLRPQRIFLEPENREYLWSMLTTDQEGLLSFEDKQADEKFFRELLEIGVALKDIQSFIARRLKAFPNCIEKITHSKIVAIDMKNGECILESTKPGKLQEIISFLNFVSADGAQRPSLAVMMKNPDNPRIECIPDLGNLHPYHVNAYVVIKREDGEILQPPENSFFTSCLQGNEEEYLCYLLFDKLGYLKHGGRQVKCNFTGELPDELFHSSKLTSNYEPVFAYINNIIKNELIQRGVVGEDDTISIQITNPSKKHGKEKDNVKFSVFERRLSQAEQASVEVDGHCFVLAGDAFRTPNYQLSHGANDALQHARYFGKMMDIPPMSNVEYNRLCAKIGQDHAKGSAVLAKAKCSGGLFFEQSIAEQFKKAKGPKEDEASSKPKGSFKHI